MGEAAQARETSVSDENWATEVGTEISWAEPLEEPDRWCVDLGDSMVVRTTAEVAAAFAARELTRRTLVWREGHAIWEPLGHFDELMSTAPRSGRRPVQPSPMGGESPVAMAVEATPAGAPRVAQGARRGTLAFSSAFAIGIVLGILVALPFAWPGEAARVDRLAPRLDATSQAAAALVRAR